MKKLTIIDGNSLLFRSFYATFHPGSPIMSTKEGIPTNAVFAFSNMMNKLVSDFDDSSYILVVFDTGKKTFRHQELDTYKANRKPLPEELKIQMPIAREFLHAMGISTYEMDGFEGDDIAGSVAKLAQKEGFEVSIYTSDHDFLQLIDSSISICMIRKGLRDIVVYTPEKLQEEYQLEPKQIPDLKGLMGDASDNLPGIPGVGQKTAIKLLNQYHTLEGVIEASKETKGKLYENILNHQEDGKLCKHLATISIDVEIPFSLEDTHYIGYDFNAMVSFCSKYELKSLLNKLSYEKANRKQSVKKEEITFEEVEDLPFLPSGSIGLAIDLEKGINNYHLAEVFGLSITIEQTSYYIKKDALLHAEIAKKVLLSSDIKKCCYDYKAIQVALARIGLEIHGLSNDFLIAAYLLDSSLENNARAILNYFGKDLTEEEQNSMEDLFAESSSCIKRTCEISYYALHLVPYIEQELKKADAFKLYEEMELPLTSVLAKMELEGFPLNAEELEKIASSFRQKISSLTLEIYELAGESFNIASPKQVGNILFQKLGLGDGKKVSTSVDVLKKIEHKHPIVGKILEYRKYSKLVSTYVDGLKVHIHADGKLHPMFHQALTTTGRLSSSEPNLQNISVRDEEGKLIRKAFFYPNSDDYILSLDYSQVELRILASLSGCKKLIDAFNQDEDIHALTARHVFHKEEVTSEERRKAKAINFGIVYGISDWGLAEQLSISPFEAREIIQSFYQTFPEVLEFMRSIAENAEKDGYVKTLFGRTRYIREFHDSSYQVREFAKRAAFNAPIQGTAADIIKIAMIQIDHMLEEHHYKTKMISQIHDELIFKVPQEEINIVFPKIQELMENACQMTVKLKADGSYARTWYDAK